MLQPPSINAVVPAAITFQLFNNSSNAAACSNNTAVHNNSATTCNTIVCGNNSAAFTTSLPVDTMPPFVATTLPPAAKHKTACRNIATACGKKTLPLVAPPPPIRKECDSTGCHVAMYCNVVCIVHMAFNQCQNIQLLYNNVKGGLKLLEHTKLNACTLLRAVIFWRRYL